MWLSLCHCVHISDVFKLSGISPDFQLTCLFFSLCMSKISPDSDLVYLCFSLEPSLISPNSEPAFLCFSLFLLMITDVFRLPADPSLFQSMHFSDVARLPTDLIVSVFAHHIWYYFGVQCWVHQSLCLFQSMHVNDIARLSADLRRVWRLLHSAVATAAWPVTHSSHRLQQQQHPPGCRLHLPGRGGATSEHVSRVSRVTRQ